MEHKMNVRFLCAPNSTPPAASGRSELSSSSTSASAYLRSNRSVTPVPLSTASFSSASLPSETNAHKSSSASVITTRNLVPDAQTSCRIRACDRCGVVFSRKVRFLHHLLVNHSIKVHEGRAILPCPSCNSAFLRNTDRSKHIQCVHRRLRPFPCPQPDCNSSFFFAKDLSKHTSTVHLRHRPFRCEVCGRSFGKREHMTSHVRRVHEQLRPFKCETCNIVLASKYNLEGHFNTVSHRAALQMSNANGKSK